MPLAFCHIDIGGACLYTAFVISIPVGLVLSAARHDGEKRAVQMGGGDERGVQISVGLVLSAAPHRYRWVEETREACRCVEDKC